MIAGVCFHCGEPIVGDYHMVGVDIPYVNLFFHRPTCWQATNCPDLNTYLASKAELVYTYKEKQGIKGKK